MGKSKVKLTSAIGWSTADKISVRGMDLPSEILGHMNLGDLAFLQLTGRKATLEESKVFNAIVITLVEHGITPSAIAARMTYMGAPESLQAAVAAGLCGLGTVFVGSMEGASKMLYEALPQDKLGTGVDLDALAVETIVSFRARKTIVPGLGHPVHKPVDPRTPRLFEIAAENGKSGEYVALMQKIQIEAEARSGKMLPINATGAIGAICCEFGFPWKIVRGFGVMARAIGLVGHILEESENPISYDIWQRVDEEILETSCPGGA
ncbi:citryl-CoA lyase [Hoeflea sp.]|uniref:citryl-CoA lyase n=1 Tax=Hoeflea sp. TaxID=1940281 RepID=UPI0019C0410F|nr:citryl-CoA lyase [Hoeflea sp.]MBC7282055.1 citryl-CoA lyase [Hoeflea sp.]